MEDPYIDTVPEDQSEFVLTSQGPTNLVSSKYGLSFLGAKFGIGNRKWSGRRSEYFSSWGVLLWSILLGLCTWSLVQSWGWVWPLLSWAASLFGQQLHDCGTSGVPGILGAIAEFMPQEITDFRSWGLPVDLKFPWLAPAYGLDDIGGSW